MEYLFRFLSYSNCLRCMCLCESEIGTVYFFYMDLMASIVNHGLELDCSDVLFNNLVSALNDQKFTDLCILLVCMLRF